MSGVLLTLDGVEENRTWANFSSLLYSHTSLSYNLSIMWVVLNFVQIFCIQIGMLMLEIGSVSPKNTKAMIIKNIGNLSVSAICFYLLGYGLCFGPIGDDFVGWGDFATKGISFTQHNPGGASYNGISLARYLYYYALIAIVPVIVSGSLSERTKICTYLVITLLVTVLITPATIHWVWSAKGWASHRSKALLNTGALDVAGSSVIHLSGGIMALIGAKIVGARRGRFEGNMANVRMPEHNVTFSALGALFLWVGYYSLNAGALSVGPGTAVGKVALNTTLCAAASALVVTIATLAKEGSFEPYSIVNGLYTGLVASCGGCATIPSEAALFTGAAAGILYFVISTLVCKCRVDDVTDMSAVTIAGGLCGTLSAAVFTLVSDYRNAVADYGEETPCGALYVCNGHGWKLLIANVCFVLAVSVTAVVGGLAIFLPLRVMGLLRVNKVTEDARLDFITSNNLVISNKIIL